MLEDYDPLKEYAVGVDIGERKLMLDWLHHRGRSTYCKSEHKGWVHEDRGPSFSGYSKVNRRSYSHACRRSD